MVHEHAHTHVNDEDVKECHEQEHSQEHTHVHNSYREIKEFILASELLISEGNNFKIFR